MCWWKCQSYQKTKFIGNLERPQLQNVWKWGKVMAKSSWVSFPNVMFQCRPIRFLHHHCCWIPILRRRKAARCFFLVQKRSSIFSVHTTTVHKPAPLPVSGTSTTAAPAVNWITSSRQTSSLSVVDQWGGHSGFISLWRIRWLQTQKRDSFW